MTAEEGVRRYGDGTWLTPRIVRFASVTSLGLAVLTIALLVGTARGTVDAFGRPLGTDFTSFWSAGSLAFAGHAPDAYDWMTLRAGQKALHPAANTFFPFSYPPLFLLVAAPLAALPYLAALSVWVSATLLAALAVFRAIVPGRLACLAALGSPIVLVSALHGQTAFLTAALLAGGVLCLRGREWLAGILFGLAAFKPHLGLLVPIALLAGGHWRAIAGAGATVGCSVALTLAIWGWPAWAAFLASMPLTQSAVLEGGGPGFAKFQSVFAWLRLCGASGQAAYAAQGAAALVVVLCCVQVWRGEADWRLKGAILLLGTLLVTPYVLDYDGVVLGMGAAFLVAHGCQHGFRPWLATMVAAAWLAPPVSPELAEMAGVPLGLMLTSGLFAMAVAESRAGGRVRPVAQPTLQPA